MRRWELNKLVRRMRSPSLADRLKAFELLRHADDGAARPLKTPSIRGKQETDYRRRTRELDKRYRQLWKQS